jgi:hypothetical protein
MAWFSGSWHGFQFHGIQSGSWHGFQFHGIQSGSWHGFQLIRTSIEIFNSGKAFS